MNHRRASRREFLRTFCCAAAAFSAGPLLSRAATSASASAATTQSASAPARPNILLLVADDLNCNSVGAFGCKVPEVTPHIDALAAEGIRFDYAHVNISVCQPSRSTWMTGRYSHHSGGEGFFHLRKPNIPILPQLLRDAGYRVGILGKLQHSTPYGNFKWDLQQDQPQLGQGRNPRVYHDFATEFMRQSKEAGRPFFLMANSHDPHPPFFGADSAAWYQAKNAPSAVKPSRVYQPQEITVPGFLPDLPEVRKELAQYFSSVRRCDDTVGAVLEALRENGAEQNTLVLFLSDNGMSFPFSKANCYLQSTKTPWIMRWPGMIKPGSVDSEHFISGIDMMPTFLEAVGLPQPAEMDGRSFLPLLHGEKQDRRDLVFTQFYQTSGKQNYPMYCVQSRRFGYLYNAWSDGQREYRNNAMGGLTMKAMTKAAASNKAVAERVNFFFKRVPEEFYDFEQDPDALHNLIDDPKYKDEIGNMRQALEQWMSRTDQLVLEAFRARGDKQKQEEFMAKIKAEIGEKAKGEKIQQE